MPKLEREIFVVIGQTGMGKTQWTKGFLRTQKRCIVLDPQGEYNGFLEFESAKPLISYIMDKKIFRVKCSDLREFPTLCFGSTLVPKTLLVIEESQRVLAPHNKIPIEFEEVIYRGRHSETSLLLVAQRATTIDIAVRSQFSQLIVFRQSEKHDLNWISDVIGKDLNDIVHGLNQLEYLHITNIGYERKKITKFY